MRIIATFVPQAWINDYAVDVDPEGPTKWDITDHILAMGKDAALALKDNDYPTDDLRYTDNAPTWIKEWRGPFYVRVKDAIRDYFDAWDGTEGQDRESYTDDQDRENYT